MFPSGSKGCVHAEPIHNLERMKTGKALQRYNHDKCGVESMELSREQVPARDGGTQVVPRWPQDLKTVDPFRHPG